MSIFDNTMKKCKVKVNDNIFPKVSSFKSISLLKLQLENSPSA